MKKILAAVLAASLCICIATGCETQNGEDSDSGLAGETTVLAEITSDSNEPEETETPKTETSEATTTAAATTPAPAATSAAVTTAPTAKTQAPVTTTTVAATTAAPVTTKAPAPAVTTAVQTTAAVTTASAQPKQTPERLKNVQKQLLDVFRGNSLYFSYTMISDDVNGDVVLAQKGTDIYIKVTSNGDTMTILSINNMSYLIDEDNKEYIKFPGNDKAITEPYDVSESYTLADLDYVSSGRESFNGAMTEYDVYKDAGGVDCKIYYTSNNTLAGMSNGSDLIVIKELSSNIPSGLFSVPAGYTEISLEDMY